MPDKQDSNVATLRFCEEDSFGVVSGNEIWYALDPNSYSDFGGQIATVARQPISQDRQNRKGLTTDVDASGSFSVDLTSTNLLRLLQGYFATSLDEKGTTAPLNGANVPTTSVATSDDSYNAASGYPSLIARHLLLASGFTNAGNNGLKQVTSRTATKIVVVQNLTDEGSPPATARLDLVGYKFDAATVDVNATPGDLPTFVRASGSVDWTTIGIEAGDWIYIGDPAVDAASDFVTAANNGWARVRSVAAALITFDKTQGTMADETGTGLSIRILFGDRIVNDPEGSAGSSYNRRSFQLERTLGDDGVDTQAEYLVGAIPSELTINFPLADKLTCDMAFVAKDHETVTGTVGVKGGTRPDLLVEDAFNTTSHIPFMRMGLRSDVDSNPGSLFAYLSELTVTFNNNVTPNKAVSVMGAFEMSLGNFDVNGTTTAYFNTVTAQAAVRDNSDVDICAAVVRDNVGFMLDIPLLSLGDGRLNVALNEPITLPLSVTGAKDGTYDYTASFTHFRYLPDAAE